MRIETPKHRDERVWFFGALVLWVIGYSSLAGAAPFRFADVDENSLGLWEGSRPVLVYNHGVISSTNAPADRARSTYVHPLYGLDGEVLTDDFPKDHYHHRGLFWSWPHVKVGEQAADLWMLTGIRHQFERWLGREARRTKANLGVQNGWFIGDRKVVDEKVWLRAWPATVEGRAIDVELTWTPLKEPLTLRGAEGKSYGGLTLRFAPFKGETIITTPDGRTKEDLPIAHLPWADLSAQFLEARVADPALRRVVRRLAGGEGTGLSARQTDSSTVPRMDSSRHSRGWEVETGLRSIRTGRRKVIGQ
jgi:hypothetical protein